jgi:hypothetical protein
MQANLFLEQHSGRSQQSLVVLQVLGIRQEGEGGGAGEGLVLIPDVECGSIDIVTLLDFKSQPVLFSV